MEKKMNEETRRERYRAISSVVTFIVLWWISGFIPALICGVFVWLTGHLRWFKAFLPDILFDSLGEPKSWAENLIAPVLMMVTGFIMFILGGVFPGLILGATAFFDLTRETPFTKRLFEGKKYNE